MTIPTPTPTPLVDIPTWGEQAGTKVFAVAAFIVIACLVFMVARAMFGSRE